MNGFDNCNYSEQRSLHPSFPVETLTVNIVPANTI